MSLRMLEKITEYITNSIWYDKNSFNERGEKIMEQIKILLNSNEFEDWEVEKIKNCLEKLRDVRNIYWRGIIFVQNSTKDHKKGSRNFTIKYLRGLLEDGDRDLAKKKALKQLEFIKQHKSERTYYRYLKEIRNLGIIV